MGRRRFRVAVAALLAMLASPFAIAQTPVATVLGEPVARESLAADAEQAARELVERVWARLERDYVATRGLAATPAELAALDDYEREFRRRDRVQRDRKLTELEERLVSGELTADERRHTLEFRDILRRLAAFEAEQDAGPPPDAAALALAAAPWIEFWKVRRALFDEFGGVVGLTRFGHYPFGARAALITRYEREGRLSFADRQLRERFHAIINAAPRDVVPALEADFTPYWTLPIPPSYYPDPVPK